MIGRDRELRLLAQLAALRRRHVAMVAGEPGIGKTRLVRELRNSLPPDMPVLVGHAEPDSLARPFELLLDAVSAAGPAAVAEADLRPLSDPGRSPVERLHTGLALVSRLAGDGPAVVVFEDLHWVDFESAALFERLADEPAPRLLIGTYRPDEITSRHPVASLLARLDRRHEVTHLRLERFTADDTAAMLAAVTGTPVPYRVAAAMAHRTGGNPFFLEELLRAHDGNDLAALCDQPLPWSLAEVLRRQVAGLDPRHRTIVETAAVLGNRIPFDLLAAVTGESEERLVAALRELVTGGVLVETGEDEFSFRHALVREALSGEMLGRQRRRVHEAALEALRGAGDADPALVAYHAYAAGRYEEMVAAARRGAAAYLAIGSAYQALRLAELGLAEVGDEVPLLASAAQAAWLAGLLEDATGYAERWRNVAMEPMERAAALYLLIRLRGDAEEIACMTAYVAEVEQLVTDLPEGDARARAMTAVARSHLIRCDEQAAVEWADRALAVADGLSPAVRLAARLEKGLAMVRQPATAPEGRALLVRVVDEAEKRGEWVLAAGALHTLVQVPAPTESPADQAEALERMRVDAERAGLEAVAVAAYFQGRARLAMREGDLGGALTALEEGWAREQGYQPRGFRSGHTGVFLAGLYLESGDLDRVEQIIEALSTVAGFLPVVMPGLAFHLACRRDDRIRAEQHLDELIGMLARQSFRSGSQTHDVVSAALYAGLPLSRVRQLAAASLPESATDWHTLVYAQLAEADGQVREALVSYRAVADVAAWPAVSGTVHTAAARCLQGLGRTSEAARHAEMAANCLRGWGGWRVAALEQVRSQLGLASASGRGPVGIAALTPREREVALLVAEGLTNLEVSRRLYISPRTAAVHVSKVLRKLEVATRTDVRAVLERSTGQTTTT